MSIGVSAGPGEGIETDGPRKDEWIVEEEKDSQALWLAQVST